MEKNEARAYQIGIEKLGGFAAKKYLKYSPMLQDAIAIPQEIMSIIGDYGEILENLPPKAGGNLLHPLSLLPHPKDKIEYALKIALGIVRNKKTRNHLETVLVFLEDFIPDDEVPEDPEENMKAWLSRRDWKSPKTRELLEMTLTKIFVEKYVENAEQKLEEFLRDRKRLTDTEND